MHAIRNIAIAAVGSLAIALAAAAMPTAALARGGHWGHGGHWGGHWGGGWGPGFVGGLVVGSALAAPYYYGGPYAYAYGPDCYVRRRVYINRYGDRVVRRVRVCD